MAFGHLNYTAVKTDGETKNEQRICGCTIETIRVIERNTNC